MGRLRSSFKANTPGQTDSAWSFLPVEASSVTNYNFAALAEVWEAMNASISAEQRDVLCAVGFRELSRQSLLVYGVDAPESFLRAVKPIVLTASLDAGSARSIVIAGVADEGALRQLVARTFGKVRTEKVENQELLVSEDEQAAASFSNGYFLLGSPEDVRRCLFAAAKQKGSGAEVAGWKALTAEAGTNASNVITFWQDRERIRGMAATIARFQGRSVSASYSDEVERVIKQLPYAVTETTLEKDGLLLRTRSPLGQFSRLVSLLSPDQSH
jgi:hypothetical protein